MRRLALAGVPAAAVVAAFLGCNALVGNDDVTLQSTTEGGAPDAPPDAACAVTPATVRVTPSVRTKVDLLFMIDNSPSMEPKANELRQTFPGFFRAFQDLAAQGVLADLHIGVVTSDYGAGGGVGAQCDPSPGGQRGRLQAVGKTAPPTCQPPLGANYVSYQFAATGAPTTNLPPGQDLATTFSCMASVGQTGCGLEHQLESVYAALTQNIPENVGFLRPDAALVVFFLTDEDDGSAPPKTDIFDPSPLARAEYGVLLSYPRQTRLAVVCGSPGNYRFPPYPPFEGDAGVLTGCIPAPSPPGKQYDVSRYIDLFTKPAAQGGVKEHPEDVMLFAIDGPSDPFDVELLSMTGNGNGVYTPCSTYSEPSCLPTLQHSCSSATVTGFFGDPAVRLNAVVRAAHTHKIYSVCDADYSAAVQDASQLIVGRDPGCFPARLADASHPSCQVSDVAMNGTRTPIPSCATAGGATPCWKLEPKAACGEVSPDGVGLTIDRGGQLAAAGTATEATCDACPAAPPALGDIPVPPPIFPLPDAAADTAPPPPPPPDDASADAPHDAPPG